MKHPEKVKAMINRRGRPPIDDRAVLRRVAEHIVDMKDRGTPCSVRAAILRTSGQASGNSAEAILSRLYRKWRRSGSALVAEVQARRVAGRQAARWPTTMTLGVPPWSAAADLRPIQTMLSQLAEVARPTHEALRRFEESMRPLQLEAKNLQNRVAQAVGPYREIEKTVRELARRSAACIPGN